MATDLSYPVMVMRMISNYSGTAEAHVGPNGPSLMRCPTVVNGSSLTR